MKEPKHANLTIILALILIAGTFLFYASWIRDWLSAAPQAISGKERGLQAGADLTAARKAFREKLLEPGAHMRLAEALYDAGRPIDSFYVLFAARSFFGEAAFERAHALTVLYRGEHFLGSEEFDPSPANEARLKARLSQEPDHAATTDYLAHIASARRDPKEALRLVEAGLAAHPSDPGLLSYRVELAWAAGDAAAAVAYDGKLAAENPRSFQGRKALEELGRLASRKETGEGGETSRLARETLQALAGRSLDEPSYFSTLAMAVWGRGDVDGVRAMVMELRSKRARHGGADAVEGALALFDRQPEKAISLFTAAWEANPDDLYSASKLAQLYYKQRADREGALPYYLALYRQNPRYDDGAPAEKRIRETLDSRRETLLRYAGIDNLGRFLTAEDASLRAEACARAAQAKDARWVDTLADLLDDDADIVRRNADYALYQIAKQAPDAIAVRREEWLSSEKPLVRARALNLFADIEPAETFPFVVKALRDPHPAVRFLAKVMVLDHYYKDDPKAAKARADYLASEKDPLVLAHYARLGAPR
ncbi:MAG: hypothetical protein AAB320_04895 [Elusimicrobiota bacterium]